VADLSKIVKARRLSRKWSLRELSSRLGVTPAYVADIEAARRIPSPELRSKIASVLDIPSEELEATELRLTFELREWIEERPSLISVLRSLRSSSESDMLIQRLARFMSRRTPPKAPAGLLLIWESELRAIAAEASAWAIETGGDLFGRWSEVPTILLATKAGPNAERNDVHFRLDVDYLRQLSGVLADDWALRYFGDWHSHHRLGLSSPSSGDQKRVVTLATRNQFTSMAEIIVTLEGTRGEPLVRIHPWFYDLSTRSDGPLPLRLKVLPGLSPIRQALISRRVLAEQDLMAWEKVPVSRIRIGSEVTPPTFEPASEVDSFTREKTITQLVEALRSESGDDVEHHITGFGSILVARLKGTDYLAFALGAAWPMAVLDVHRMNRTSGTTEPFKKTINLVAADIPGFIKVYQGAKASEDGSEHVDN
jgi:transcriptional regulator with XRE-family HTH domain